MRKLALWVTAGSAIAAVAVLVETRTERGTESSRDESDSAEASSADTLHKELARMRQSLARLELQQGEWQRETVRVRADHEDVVDPDEADASRALESPALTPAEQREMRAAILDDAIREQGVDGQWSRQAESKLLGRLQETRLSGATNTTAKCARTLCRLDISFADTDSRDAALSPLFASIPWNFDAYYRAADDDEQHMIVYVTREGEALPALAMAP